MRLTDVVLYRDLVDHSLYTNRFLTLNIGLQIEGSRHRTAYSVVVCPEQISKIIRACLLSKIYCTIYIS